MLIFKELFHSPLSRSSRGSLVPLLFLPEGLYQEVVTGLSETLTRAFQFVNGNNVDNNSNKYLLTAYYMPSIVFSTLHSYLINSHSKPKVDIIISIVLMWKKLSNF